MLNSIERDEILKKNRLGFFIAMAKSNFGKDYKTPRELVTLLENRGLIINDKQKAQLYLESIGYYRLHPLDNAHAEHTEKS